MKDSTRNHVFNIDAFAKVWNAAGDAVTATEALKTVYKNTPVADIHKCVDLLTQAGVIQPLPVRQGDVELTEGVVFEFCLLWARCTTFEQVVRASKLPEEVVAERYRILTTLGIVLDNKLGAGNVDLERKLRIWSGDVSKINAALDGELVIRSALLHQRAIKDNLAAALALLANAKKQTTADVAIDNNIRGAVSLIEAAFRDMGVNA